MTRPFLSGPFQSLFASLSVSPSFCPFFVVCSNARNVSLKHRVGCFASSETLLPQPQRWWWCHSVGSVTETKCMIYRHYFTFRYMRHCIVIHPPPPLALSLSFSHSPISYTRFHLYNLSLSWHRTSFFTVRFTISNEHNFLQQFITFSLLLSCFHSSTRTFLKKDGMAPFFAMKSVLFNSPRTQWQTSLLYSPHFCCCICSRRRHWNYMKLISERKAIARQTFISQSSIEALFFSSPLSLDLRSLVCVGFDVLLEQRLKEFRVGCRSYASIAEALE